MAETDLKVILKAKELAEHTLRITSNCPALSTTTTVTTTTVFAHSVSNRQ